MAIPRNTAAVIIKLALSGRAPVSIHMLERRDTRDLLLVSDGKKSLAVTFTPQCDSKRSQPQSAQYRL